MSWVRALGVPRPAAPDDAPDAPDSTPSDSEVPGGSGNALAVPDGLVLRAIATLDPGYFAWVMATGIISIGTDLLGHPLLSQVNLGVTVVAFGALVLAYVARLVFFGSFFRQSVADPTTAVAYSTVVAGTDVLAVRLAMAHHPLIAFGLGTAAAAVWLVLTYALPWSIVVTARRPVLGEINGTWLVWVVATQSLSIIADAVASGPRRNGCGPT